MSGEHSQLPDGYYFSDFTGERELAELFSQVNGSDTSETPIQDRQRTAEELGIVYIDARVRDQDDILVGFGSLAYERHLGLLCDFVVSPMHRSRGIGKAIIDERLRRADESGVTQLCIPVIQDTNTLSTYYIARGFSPTESGALVRGNMFGLSASRV